MKRENETAQEQPKKYNKNVILNLKGKDEYITDHYLVFKTVLKDDKYYTVEEAKKEVKEWLESEAK